jgi:hypothetical protein
MAHAATSVGKRKHCTHHVAEQHLRIAAVDSQSARGTCPLDNEHYSSRQCCPAVEDREQSQWISSSPVRAWDEAIGARLMGEPGTNIPATLRARSTAVSKGRRGARAGREPCDQPCGLLWRAWLGWHHTRTGPPAGVRDLAWRGVRNVTRPLHDHLGFCLNSRRCGDRGTQRRGRPVASRGRSASRSAGETSPDGMQHQLNRTPVGQRRGRRRSARIRRRPPSPGPFGVLVSRAQRIRRLRRPPQQRGLAPRLPTAVM